MTQCLGCSCYLPDDYEHGSCQYCREERDTRLRFGYEICGQWTNNGWVWAQPCCKPVGHDGDCRCNLQPSKETQ